MATSVDHPVVTIGDFNHPTMDWLNTSSAIRRNNLESAFVDCCNECGLTQLVSKLTNRDGVILDSLLTTDPDLVETLAIAIVPSPENFDHMAISFSLKLGSADCPVVSSSLNFRDMDEDAIAHHLDAIDWNLFFTRCHSVDDMYHEFMSAVNFSSPCSCLTLGEMQTPQESNPILIDRGGS